MDSPREAVRDEMEWRAEACLDANDACRDATCNHTVMLYPASMELCCSLCLGSAMTWTRRVGWTH